jgi:exosortase
MTQLASQYAPRLGVRWGVIAFCALLILLWGGLVHKLTTDWSTNPQYEFGYFVPIFVIYLLVRRWEDRPAPSTQLPSLMATLALVFCLLLLLPTTIVQEANPDWRPLNWVHATLVVGATFLLFARVGGFFWATHFLVPLLLVFFCLPWPLAMEQGMIKELTGAVTRVTVELLNWINVPALQRGNIIDTAAGPVGVADACSGMRSLAGTLMASAFFGEYYRLSWPRRVALIIGGSLIAFGLNITRTFFLGWRTAVEGGQAVDKWHDPAGFTIFAISFAALWVVARAVSGNRDQPRHPSAPFAPDTHLPLPTFACIFAWLFGIHIISEAWYRYREGERIQSESWTVALPRNGGELPSSGLPDEVRSVLRYSAGSSATVDWPDGRSWNVILLQWEAGRSSAQLATMHRPEICMPAAGYVFIGPAAPLDLTTTGPQLKFDGSIFDANGHRVFVYRCLWEEQSGSGRTHERRFDMSIHGRLMSSWHGRRNLGQKLLQVAISGAGTESEAREDFKRRMPELIVAQT